ncbi:MAG: hypothetical protein U1F98_06065 [Verrucomicrobiota bacterium]
MVIGASGRRNRARPHVARHRPGIVVANRSNRARRPRHHDELGGRAPCASTTGGAREFESIDITISSTASPIPILAAPCSNRL